MKKVLLTLAAGLMALGASAAVELNVNDATNIQGTHVEETYKDDGSVNAAEKYQPLQSFELGGYTFTFTSTSDKDGQQPAYYFATSTSSNKQKTVRIYTGTTMTITAPAGVVMTGIDFTGSNLGKDAAFTVSTGTITTANNAVWVGEATSFSLTTNASWRITKLTIKSGDDPVVVPPTPSGDAILDETLLTEESYGKFTVDNVLLPEAASYIWTFDSRYGAKASAYIQGTSYASESWLISPVVDLTDYTEVVLAFEHACNKFPDVDFMKANCLLMARVEGGEWANVAIPTYSNNDNWNFVASGDIALTAYEGKKMQFAYKYVSEDGKSGTWEVKNVKVTGEKGAGVADIEAAEAAPVEYFNLQGVRVANPENGLYIRRQGTKVAKVLVK